MCYVLAAGAFCAVFTPVPIPAKAVSPAAIVQAKAAAPRSAVTPASVPEGEAGPISRDAPAVRRGEALPDGARPSAAPRIPGAALARTTRLATADTETKGSADDRGAVGGAAAGDTERK